MYSPRYLPRKGTETPLNSFLVEIKIKIRHDTYPARGRKPSKSSYISCGVILIRHDTYPARGRKLDMSEITEPLGDVFATILTPQGDGNPQYSARNKDNSAADSPRYLPRKGTETSDRNNESSLIV